MVRTYALIDLIGLKNALKDGTGAVLLQNFWKMADAWTMTIGNEWPPIPVLGKSNQLQQPTVYVVTLSDSALLHTEPEVEIDDFYEIAISLKDKLESNAGRSFVIINRDEEIEYNDFPALGAVAIGSDMRPTYFRVAGSGPAWINLILANEIIECKTVWHDQYTIYGVGKKSIPRNFKIKDQCGFKDLDRNDIEIYALEREEIKYNGK